VHRLRNEIFVFWSVLVATGFSTISGRARTRALAQIQKDDEVARVEAAKILSSDPASFVPLRKLLKIATQPELRLSIVFALSWQRDMRSWTIFIKIFGDENESPAVRAQAAEGLAYYFYRKRRGTPSFHSAIELLEEALADPSPDVRYYAAFALGAAGERGSVPALRRIAKDKSTSENFVGTVGDEAMDAITQIKGNVKWGS
jgi:HEAT repeat protein